MRRDLADIVCCPVHKTRLELTATEVEEGTNDIVRGTLRCKQCCFDYPIEDGIPNLLPPEYHVDEVREAQPKARKGKAAKADPA